MVGYLVVNQKSWIALCTSVLGCDTSTAMLATSPDASISVSSWVQESGRDLFRLYSNYAWTPTYNQIGEFIQVQ